MNKIFREEIGQFVAVYLDDIIIFSDTFDTHLQYLQLIFKRLKNVRLKLEKDKCEFAKLELAFLGHIMSE